MTRIFGLTRRDHDLANHMAAAARAGYTSGAMPEQVATDFPEMTLGCVTADSGRSHSNDGRIAVICDGGVFNMAEIGETGGDAAAIAALYRRHGFEKMLAAINGDFAIALYDRDEDTLWLGRDRLGIKPLYYINQPGLFAFASRPRSLLAIPTVDPAVNRRFTAVFAASHYRYIDNRPSESPYQAIAQLPGGHWLRLRGGNVQIGQYWRLEDAPNFNDTEDTLAERYRELLSNAVAIRLEKTRNAAFTLSGGMDSSSVMACAARSRGERQVAYSTVYSDKTYDETDEIRSMLDSTVSKWNPVKVDNPDVFGTIGRMVDAHDEPVATATWLSHFLLCEQVAKAGHDALFGGLGGDELNAGEYEYFFFHFADIKQAKRDADLQHEIDAWAHHHDHPIFRKNTAVAMETLARCTDQGIPGRCLPDERRMRRYYSALDKDYFPLDSFIPFMEAPFKSYLKSRSYQDLTSETAPCCLRAQDRQSMAFGLENYAPFFDHRLVEFMFRVPGSLKIRDGVTKILLRKAMQGVLPEETRTRIKKTGWNAPAHVWFSGEGRDQLMDMLHSQRFRERGVYNVSEVIRLADEHQAIMASDEPRENHMMFFWQLVNTEIWLDRLG